MGQNAIYYKGKAYAGGGGGSGTSNLSGETEPQSSEGEDNALYMQYSTDSTESAYETEWEGSVSTSAWASPVQIGTVNPSEYYRIKITGTGSGERLVSEIPVVGSGDLWNLGHEMYIFIANDCTELWLYSSTGYSNTVTKVEATTYDEGIVDSIEKVYGKIKGKWYEIATGGGTGSGYEEEQLYLATSTSFSNITVDWDWNAYDAYVFRAWDVVTSTQSGDSTFLTKQQVLDAISNNVPQYFTNSYGYVSYNISASMLTTVNRSNSMFLQEIVGIKFGDSSGGGGTVFEGLDYSNSEDLTLPDNNGYDYTPTEDGALMVTSYGNVGALCITGILPNDTVYLMHGGDRWTTSWCFVEKDVQLHLYRGSASSGWVNGTWIKFIPLKQHSSGGGSSEINYSTEEQEIGTWIDGSPLYQKTFIVDGTYGGRQTVDVSASIPTNIDLRYAEGQCSYQYDGVWYYYSLGTYFSYPWENINTFKVDIGSATVPVKAYITIRYTKTTD